MAGTAQFNRVYVDFEDDVREFEKTPDVTAVIDHFMATWGYVLSNMIEGKFTAQWLRENEKTGKLEDELDLIFEIVGTPWFEVVLRDDEGGSRYGGWLEGQMPIEITDEIVNGYRVILTTLEDGSRLRHEFLGPERGYEPATGAAVAPLRSHRRKVMRKAG